MQCNAAGVMVMQNSIRHIDLHFPPSPSHGVVETPETPSPSPSFPETYRAVRGKR